MGILRGKEVGGRKEEEEDDCSILGFCSSSVCVGGEGEAELVVA